MKQKIYFSLISAIIVATVILSFHFNSIRVDYAMDNIHQVPTEWNWWQQDVLKGTYWFEYQSEIKECRIATHECEVQ